MLPFISIGTFTIATYGLMILVGILCGMLLLWLRARHKHYPVQDALFGFFYSILGAVVGGKLFYLAQTLPQIVTYWHTIITQPALIMGFLTGGFVFYGSLIGGFLGALIYAKQFHLPFIPLIEMLIPAVPLIHGFGRIGCFLTGCCYGIPYNGPFSVTFTLSQVAPLGIPLFPVQLLESALLFLLAAFLLIYDVRVKRPRSLVGCYLLGYGVIRFITEMFRGDAVRGSLWVLSTSQWLSLVGIIVGIILLVRLRIPPRSERTPGPARTPLPPQGSSEEGPLA